ncbi:3-isopropylmalate dehydratase large subunit [Parvularcula sp. LCG005]|uniref:3-isopropylmalate dehydratase large subunit n=1 Tax=Parvularcula sp. LCG005 TaxID=3078805 RepID=UPI002942BB91|nr:3-isopropylmalate dehydratase large subunit [Parvularcula sp. LCG005]WOI53110.1 3-isopropylmalate dehydratase large subunit [Parvularcula sp. LCG005]
MAGKTLFEKVWERNVISPEMEDRPAILHVGLHLVHEVTSPQAFKVLDDRGLKVRRPDLTLATMDHSTPTTPVAADGSRVFATDAARSQVETLERNCAAHGIELLNFADQRRGIVHMVGPEMGRTQPGIVIVCGDSHTSTHGAFGALAFGIGTTEVGHVLATQSLFQRRPKTMRIRFEGDATPGVSAKDLALAMIAQIGAGGAAGHVIEYCGPAIEALEMEGRMTLCNLSIEGGARAGMVAPDDVTFDYLRGRAGAPADFDAAVADWKTLYTDDDAVFDREVVVDVSQIEPMVTFGVSPDAGTRISQMIPHAHNDDDAQALLYMGMNQDTPLTDVKVDRVFVGSCTNGRLSDLRVAADVLRGHKVAPGLVALIVPGSEQVKKDAEAEGLHEVFIAAGAEWREPGCSMCIAMNGDRGQPGELVVSTSNRNFKGRQGEGVRTVLASPATAAASAIEGRIADPRPYLTKPEAA